MITRYFKSNLLQKYKKKKKFAQAELGRDILYKRWRSGKSNQEW